MVYHYCIVSNNKTRKSGTQNNFTFELPRINSALQFKISNFYMQNMIRNVSVYKNTLIFKISESTLLSWNEYYLMIRIPLGYYGIDDLLAALNSRANWYGPGFVAYTATLGPVFTYNYNTKVVNIAVANCDQFTVFGNKGVLTVSNVVGVSGYEGTPLNTLIGLEASPDITVGLRNSMNTGYNFKPTRPVNLLSTPFITVVSNALASQTGSSYFYTNYNYSGAIATVHIPQQCNFGEALMDKIENPFSYVGKNAHFIDLKLLDADGNLLDIPDNCEVTIELRFYDVDNPIMGN